MRPFFQVRMMGAIDRLLVLFAAEEQNEPSVKDASGREAERRKCTRQLAECILAIRDVSRASEVSIIHVGT